ncbi:hypothetical protein JTE90_026476 [Oedothorax gibbosus]|uniref:Uncharacterized protein n=1 Tax=Oedothorax gibbosus TaxID=931172 RepID=A0AAV6VRA2_9ARAC|nr:hypothetical protein JTE90_026476 [Oedothorax gibbosus]
MAYSFLTSRKTEVIEKEAERKLKMIFYLLGCCRDKETPPRKEALLKRKSSVKKKSCIMFSNTCTEKEFFGLQ